MHPRHYRLRFLVDFSRVIVLPQLMSNALLYLLGVKSILPRIALSLFSVPFSGVLRIVLKRRRDAASARALGAVPVPVVRGKWPGNLDVMLGLIHSLRNDYIMQFLDDLFRQHNCKTLNLRLLWEDQIWTIDENHVKYMLSGPGFEWFHKGYYVNERLESFLGNGIFNRDRGEWHTQRAIARPWFAKDRISDLNTFNRHAERALEIISTYSQENEAFDVQDLFSRFTLDSASEFLFGKCLDTLHGVLPVAGSAKMGPKGTSIEDEFGTFAWAFEDIQMHIAHRTRIGRSWPLFELFGERTAGSIAIVQNWLQPIVREALERKRAARADKDEEERTFLSHLTDSTDDPQTIGFAVLNMLLAGRDTTASVLSYTVYFLALHADIMRKLRAEILHAYGTTGRPSIEGMKDLKYMRAVLNETMRLFPPVPLNIRQSDQSPHVFPASENTPSYHVPPNTVILYTILLIHRRKDLWGADALEYRPERWLDPKLVKRISENPFMYTPFHAGPRLCLGQNFAYNEMSFFLVLLLQRFEQFTLAPEAQPNGSLPPPAWRDGEGRQAVERIWPASAMTAFIKGGLWMKAVPVYADD